MAHPELREAYLQQYTEVCRSYHAIHDFRAKLLALLPLTSGLGAVGLLLKESELRNFFPYIGIMGILVTLGLYIYELRGTQRCYQLKSIARDLESSLGLHRRTAQFLGEPAPILNVIREGVAGGVIYLVVSMGWALIMMYGLQVLPLSFYVGALAN